MSYITVQPGYVLSTNRFEESLCLQNGISHFYEFTTDRTGDNPLPEFPHGCLDIRFSCDPKAPRGEILGTCLSCQETALVPDTRYFGVRFQCGFFPGFLLLPLSEMLGQVVAFEDFVPEKDRNLAEEMAEADGFHGRIALFLEFYRKQENRSNFFSELTASCVGRILAEGGTVSVEELSRDLHYSRRYLEKAFQVTIGIRPGQLCRIVRFQNFLYHLSRKPHEKLTELAMECGYYDQSHLIRDFKTFTNLTPRKYAGIIIGADYSKRLKDYDFFGRADVPGILPHPEK